MTTPPPPDSHPTGPPSGPLSGPSSGTPAGPSHEPTQVGSGPQEGRPEQPAPPGPPTTPGGPGSTGGGGSGGGGSGGGGSGGEGSGDDGSGGASGTSGGKGGGKPWWRSAPRVAISSAVVVAAVILTVVLTRPDGTSGSGEVFLQPAAAEGPDPYTKSTAKDSSAPASPTATPAAPSGEDNGTAAVRGSAPGLYGGSRNAASCDVDQQIGFLQKDRTKAAAFAGVAGIDVGSIPSYLRSLTPVQLRMDTRVTNHGFKDGKATAYQSVLQTGTAVMVDSRGVPRVRCACGNPLTPPVAVKGTPKTAGKAWPAYRSSDVVVVQEATTVVNVFVLVDPDTGQWFQRPKGDTGGSDVPTTPPTQTPSASPSSPTPSSQPPSGPSGSTPSSPPSAPGTSSAPPDSGTPGPESPAPPSEAPDSASQGSAPGGES
ncbi:DUF6777 domain-containing protein [Streptomyces sp. NPDC017993]|uniref:DUF6777 domain-containing protein n=1 Tax=Streptomyces sp. NPDC017993 TaxID=3365027 RepID=UPI00379DF244